MLQDSLGSRYIIWQLSVLQSPRELAQGGTNVGRVGRKAFNSLSKENKAKKKGRAAKSRVV